MLYRWNKHRKRSHAISICTVMRDILFPSVSESIAASMSWQHGRCSTATRVALQAQIEWFKALYGIKKNWTRLVAATTLYAIDVAREPKRTLQWENAGIGITAWELDPYHEDPVLLDTPYSTSFTRIASYNLNSPAHTRVSEQPVFYLCFSTPRMVQKLVGALSCALP